MRDTTCIRTSNRWFAKNVFGCVFWNSTCVRPCIFKQSPPSRRCTNTNTHCQGVRYKMVTTWYASMSVLLGSNPLRAAMP